MPTTNCTWAQLGNHFFGYPMVPEHVMRGAGVSPGTESAFILHFRQKVRGNRAGTSAESVL
jgi:hypothetical protein